MRRFWILLFCALIALTVFVVIFRANGFLSGLVVPKGGYVIDDNNLLRFLKKYNNQVESVKSERQDGERSSEDFISINPGGSKILVQINFLNVSSKQPILQIYIHPDYERVIRDNPNEQQKVNLFLNKAIISKYLTQLGRQNELLTIDEDCSQLDNLQTCDLANYTIVTYP